MSFQISKVGDDDSSVGDASAGDGSKDVSTVEPGTDVGKAAKIMREKDIGAMPVVKNRRLVCIFTERFLQNNRVSRV